MKILQFWHVFKFDYNNVSGYVITVRLKYNLSFTSTEIMFSATITK